jgi:hypothetical protein
VAGGSKYDHPPLLAPGRHPLSVAEIERLCVFPFSTSKSRQKLFYAFEEMVQQFLRERMCCDFLINGSFLTQKIDPSDVDIAVRVDVDFHDSMTASQHVLVDAANNEGYISGIDSYVYVSYPRDHVLYDTNANERETWAEQWGLEHSEQWLKGMAVLRLGETDVGLRIRR